MKAGALNLHALEENACFGCGPANAGGLQVEIFRDPEDPRRLLGEFHPAARLSGFPGVTHGGAIYTVMDCMATWCGMVLRETKALWMLRSATMKYHRPALEGQPIALSAAIENEGSPWEAIEVHAEARNPKGDLLAEGWFRVIPVPPERFKQLLGLDELPANWAAWLEANPAGEPRLE